METIWNMEDAGYRLRFERERLGLKQEDLANALGVTPVTQRNYESGRRQPTAQYLAGIEAKGLDVLYVLTGARSVGERLAEEEANLVAHFRRASPELKAAALRMLGAEPAPSRPAQRREGPTVNAESIGGVVQGNQTVKGPMTFHLGGGGSRKKGVSKE